MKKSLIGIENLVAEIKKGFTTKEVAKKFNLKTRQVQYRIWLYEKQNNEKIIPARGHQKNRPGNKKYFFNEEYFLNIDNENKAYILGFLYADGSNDKKGNRVVIQIGENDKYLLEFIKKELDFNAPIRIGKAVSVKHQNKATLCFGSKKLCQILESKGLVPPPKDGAIVFPDENIISRQLVPSFILGFFDGDGCAFKQSKKYKRMSISCASVSFLNDLQKFLIDKNIKTSISKNRNSFELTTTSIQETEKFRDLIYKNNSFFLKRKHNILCE